MPESLYNLNLLAVVWGDCGYGNSRKFNLSCEGKVKSSVFAALDES
jgi:hypothetical protein